MATYWPGAVVQLRTTFTVAGVPTDPGTVALTIQEPNGTETTYTFAASQIIKEGVGVYYRDVTYSTAGLWVWRWLGTGAAAGPDEGTDTVEQSLLNAPAFCSVQDVNTLRRDAAGGARDDHVQALIVDCSSLILEWTGRRILPLDTSATARLFDVPSGFATSREIAVHDLSATPTVVETLDSTGDLSTTLVVADDVILLPHVRDSWQPIEQLRFPAAAVPSRGMIRVTGKWGWPAVPGFVRHACAGEVVEWLKDSQALTEQSPDQYEPGAPPARALSLRTRTALNSIRRWGVA